MKLSKEVEPRVLELQKKRLELKRLVERADSTATKIEALEKKNTSMTLQTTDAIREGKDTAKMEVEAKQIKFEKLAAEDLYAELINHAIPKATDQVKALENDLKAELKEKIVLVKAERTIELDKKLEEALSIVENYRQEIVSLFQELNLHYDAETGRVLVTLFPKSELFKSYLRNSLHLSGVGVC